MNAAALREIACPDDDASDKEPELECMRWAVQALGVDGSVSAKAKAGRCPA